MKPILMVGRQLSHYRILSRAGSGTMGEVYRAEDERLKRSVALKMLPEALAADPDRLARFQIEAETLAQLDHPNIVTIYSVDEAEGLHFLTMAWVEGQTLEQALKERGLLLDGFFDIAVPLAEAVAAAHQKGITHRDLKPANIMLTEEGGLKVLDFGLARSVGTLDGLASGAQTLTREGMLVGSLPYMSPEQVRGEAADPCSDVFALGTILYEIATGERPFQGATSSDLISSILRDSPPPVDQLRPELPRHLGRIVRRCLHKDPDRRYETARGLRNALADLRTEVTRRRPDLHSIAVLPFVDMSPERDHGYFCEGIAEEILNALSSLESLRVAARATSFQLRDGAIDLREIGTRLGVGAILDGSVRKAGERVRITAQLINVADGYHLWSERYDRELSDIFAIQDEIAENVVQALEVTLSPQQRESLKTPTAQIEAYDYYLRGRYFMEQMLEGGYKTALGMFEKAVAIDADYAPAWAGIADSHSWLFAWYGSCSDDLDEADRVSLKAVELAPDSAEAHASRGYVLSLRGDSGRAATEFERSIELNPRLFEAYWYYGRDRFGQGANEHAAQLMEKAAAVRPEDYQALLLQAQFYGTMNEPEKSRAAAERAIERARRRLELNPSEARAYYLGAGALIVLGRRAEGLEWAERALALGPDEPTTLYNVACTFAVAGEIERSLDHLEKALAHNFGFREWLDRDSDLNSLRSHPRFRALLESHDSIGC